MNQLKGFHGIRPGTTEDFTPEMYADLPDADKPVFTLEAMTVSERQDFYDTYFELSGDKLVMLKGKRSEAMKAVIVPKVKAAVNWPLSVVDVDFYESLGLEVRSALYSRILNGADVTTSEAQAVKS